MKRIIYIVLFALAFASGCSKVSSGLDVFHPDQERSYIFFESKVLESIDTKSGLITGTSFPQDGNSVFGVVGYYGATSVFSGYNNGIANVTIGTDGVCTYDKLGVWQNSDPDATTKHRFYAFYPYSINADINLNSGNPYIEYTQPATSAAMVDVLTACTETAKVSGVDLGFVHRLWALDVKITNSLASSLTINSITLEVNGFPKETKIPLDPDTANNPTSSLSDEKVVLESPYVITIPADKMTIGTTASQSYGSLLFAPVPANTFKYKLRINYTDSYGKDTFTFPNTGYKELAVAFEEGKRYTLEINKTEDAFVLGSYESNRNDQGQLTPGAWSDVKVEHEFN